MYEFLTKVETKAQDLEIENYNNSIYDYSHVMMDIAMSKNSKNYEDELKTNKGYDYDEAVELAGHGFYNYQVLLTCCIISIACALDMFAFGIIVAASSCDLRLTMQQKGLLSSVPFSGLFFAFLWGYYADKFGRKKALIWSTSVGFVFASLTSIASEMYTMFVFKFIGCAFSTASFSLSMTYLGECTCTKHRSQFMQILNCFNVSSEIVTFALAYACLTLDFKIPLPWLAITLRPWRLLTFILALPLGIGSLMMLFLHESPKFLANDGQIDKALVILQKIFRINGGSEEYQVKMIIFNQTETKSKSNFLWSLVKSAIPLFKPPLLWRTLQLFYLILVICSTNNAFTMWFPIIVNNFFLAGNEINDQSFCQRINNNSTITTTDETDFQMCNDTISTNTIICGIIFGTVFTFSNMMIIKLTSWKKLVIICTFLVSASGCVLINLVNDKVANIVFFGFIQLTCICIGIAASYFVDLFPTSYRALVTSLGMMTARLGSFTAINLIGVVITDYCDITFYLWAVFVLSGIIVAMFLPPDKVKETKKPVDMTVKGIYIIN